MKKKDTVSVLFEFPREHMATVKYMCTKKGITVKKLLNDVLMEVVKNYIDEETAEDNPKDKPLYKQIEIV